MDFIKPFQDAFSTLLGYLPQLVGALVILVVGYIVAKIVGAVVRKVLSKVGFDRVMERAGVATFLKRTGTGLTPSGVLGKVVFWFMFVIAFTMFASALGVPQISGFLNQMVGYIPRIFAAIAILFLAILLANFVGALIRGATGNDTLARVGRYAIVVYAVFAALTQLGVAVQLTGSTLLIVLAGAALAAAIAFGWGGRDIARDLLGRLVGSAQDGQRDRTQDTAPTTAPTAAHDQRAGNSAPYAHH